MKNNWPTKKLGEACIINPSKREVQAYSDGLDVSFVPMSAVNGAQGRIVSFKTRKLKDVKKGYTYFKEKDILFAKITPCMENGKIAIAENLVNGIGFGTTEFHVLRANEGTMPEWVYLYLRQQSFREEAEKHMTGTAGQQRVPKDFLENVEIPLPSPIGQKQTLKKLEKILSKIEKAKKFRQGAIEETEKLIESSLHEAFFVKSWPIKKLGEVIELHYGKGIPRSERNKDGKYIIYGANGPLGRADKFLIEGEAVIIGRKGSAGKITRVSGKVWPSDVTYFALGNENVNVSFLFYLLRYLDLSKLARGVKPGISRNDVYDLEILFPPVSEQRRIASYLDKLQEKITHLQALQSQTEKELDQLQQAVLAKAFMGELIK